MTINLLLLLLLLLLVVGLLPVWSRNSDWTRFPSGVATLLLVAVVLAIVIL